MSSLIYDINTFDANTGSTNVSFLYDEAIVTECRYNIYDDYSSSSPITPEPVVIIKRPCTSFTIDNSDNLLENGNRYFIEITITTNVGTTYTFERKEFKCRANPEFEIIAPDTISSTSINIGLQYSQHDTNSNIDLPEELNEFEIQFYNCDSNRNKTNLITSSKTLYSIDDKILFTVDGLENNKTYYIEAIGTTTDKRKIVATKCVTVALIDFNPSGILQVKNHPCEAYISVQVSVNAVLYRTDFVPEFVDDTFVNLSNNILEYYDGINYDGNFSLMTDVIPKKINDVLLNISNRIVLRFCDNKVEKTSPMIHKLYFELNFYDENGTLIKSIESDYIKKIYISNLKSSNLNNTYRIKISLHDNMIGFQYLKIN